MNSLHRCIFLPVVNLSGEFKKFRNRYDILSKKCPPHITIVFPFHSLKTNDQIVKAISSICKNLNSLTLKLGGPIKNEDFIVLPVISNQKWIITIHEKLSKKCGLQPSTHYQPHITIGRKVTKLNNSELAKLSKNSSVNIQSLVFEEIQADESSKVLLEKWFTNKILPSKMNKSKT